MQRIVFFAYGIGCYLLFFATYAYFACFVGDLLAPRTIDSGPPASLAWAAAIDIALVFAFGLQHSVMARPTFKRAWTKIVPEPIERSTYVHVSCIVTALLMWQWRAIDLIIWDVRWPAGRAPGPEASIGRRTAVSKRETPWTPARATTSGRHRRP